MPMQSLAVDRAHTRPVDAFYPSAPCVVHHVVKPSTRRVRPRLRPVVLHVHIDNVTINQPQRQPSIARAPTLQELWPSVPRPDGPETWSQMGERFWQQIWPLLSCFGTALLFLVGRIGIGLRFEDLRAMRRGVLGD